MKFYFYLKAKYFGNAGIRITVQSIVLIMVSIFCVQPIEAQEIINYKSSFPEDLYAQYLEDEENIIESPTDTSKISGYLKIAWDILRYSDELCLYYGEQAFELSEKIDSDSLMAQSSMRIGLAHVNMGNFDLAADHMERDIKYWAETKDSLLLALVYGHYGYLERSRGNHYQGIEYLYKSKSINLKFKPITELIGLENALVIAYTAIGDHENVVKIGEAFLEEYFKTNESLRMVRNILANMHSSLLALEKFERADELSTIFIPLFINDKAPKTKFYGYSQAHAKATRNEEFEIANNYADSALTMAHQTKIKEHLGNAYFAKYRSLKNLNRDTEAIINLEKVRSYYSESNRDVNMVDLAEAYSLEMANAGNYKKAYEDLFLSDSLRKEIFKENIADKVRNLEKKIIQEENEKQVALLNDKNTAIERNLRQEKNLRYLLLTILGISAISGALLWNFYNQRKKLNRLLIDKNQKLEVALKDNQFLVKEVHHRVKNNMQVIASLLNLQSRAIKNEQAKEAIVASKTRILSMSLLHKNIYGNENLKTTNLQIYFTDLLNSLENTYAPADEKIKIESRISNIEVDLDTAVHLGLLANEMISNAFKHAFKDQSEGLIKFDLSQDKSNLILVIEDNGEGISDESFLNKSKSLGIRLINSFTKKLSAELQINTDEGTKFTVIVPLKK